MRNVLCVEMNRVFLVVEKNPTTHLTQTVVSIVCQIEAIIASAAIIPWYIVALVYTAAIVLQVTLINV